MRKELKQSIQRRARQLLYSGTEPDWTAALARADGEHTCGARCKQTGRPCPVRVEPGKRRCYLMVERRRRELTNRSSGSVRFPRRGIAAPVANGDLRLRRAYEGRGAPALFIKQISAHRLHAIDC